MLSAIDAPYWTPRESRRVAWAIGGSLLLHLAVLMLLPPLVRESAQPMPEPLEVRLVAPLSPPAVVPRLPEPAAPPQPVRHVHQAVLPAAAADSRVPAPAAAPALAVAEPSPAATKNPRAPLPSAVAVSEPPLTPPDLRAAYLSNPRPPYPLAARRLGVEGRVVLRVEVLADGRCGEIALSQSSGHAVLDAAALEAVKGWRFVPATRAGQAVAAWVEIPISFRLDGREG